MGIPLPITPLPDSLVFHSRPGAPNVLYLNFCGEAVSGTEWNDELGRWEIVALPFSTDSDVATFSDSEQLVIKRVWQRVAEDYAPFDVDVTTERPSTFTVRTAHALITRSTDANGQLNPEGQGNGGIAYVNVFGSFTYAHYRPVWIYHNNLGNREANIAEAVSHEVGHNLGLSHDGTTEGSDYYGGHGTGDTSWGPVMGTGYNRNVSQWSKGEYYHANNTQDDLGIVAAKLSYRADDHGNTSSAATRLVISSGSQVVASTPEDDPDNFISANKGVLERNTDVDVFSFVTATGEINIAVNPWVTPSGLTRGGNADLRLELFSEAGTLLATSDPGWLTSAQIKTNVIEGRYFLHVRNSGSGDPFSSTPTGYTAYASIGQYYITGTVAWAEGLVVAPVAELQVTDVTSPATGPKQFTVTYRDDFGIKASTIDASDIRVTGPNGYNRTGQLLSLDTQTDGTVLTATYAATPPSGNAWVAADNGSYTIAIEPNQVGDIQGAWVKAASLGQFRVAVPATLYSAHMDTHPGWSLEPQWAYGLPAYPTSFGPQVGYSGSHVIGYNLSGDYENRLTTRYATTPVIDCSGTASLTLRFRRWLRLKSGDTASIEVTADGTSWREVWSTSGSVADWGWQDIQYTLPGGVAGSRNVRQIRRNQRSVGIWTMLNCLPLIRSSPSA
jgi:hypothetical protein